MLENYIDTKTSLLEMKKFKTEASRVKCFSNYKDWYSELLEKGCDVFDLVSDLHPRLIKNLTQALILANIKYGTDFAIDNFNNLVDYVSDDGRFVPRLDLINGFDRCEIVAFILQNVYGEECFLDGDILCNYYGSIKSIGFFTRLDIEKLDIM